jgi:SAM-dependent methyltransferase
MTETGIRRYSEGHLSRETRAGRTLDRLVCVGCASSLTEDADYLRCAECDARYEVAGGIPIVLPPRLGAQKRSQGAFFDVDVDTEWEVVRPVGAPTLYQRLLQERFTRAVRGLEHLLPGASVLVVCGGSGMDAEFLVRAGASVVTTDISQGAASRALERARRNGLDLVSIVADAEKLPFRDRSFDLVYVHDGLHHLEEPTKALDEMARVAARAVALTEPAKAALTWVAVRAGYALDREGAGNRVARLTLEEARATLAARGFRVVIAERYGMYYRHEPGRAVRLLSHQPLRGIAQASLRVANALAGRVGNKLTLQAVRESAGSWRSIGC